MPTLRREVFVPGERAVLRFGARVAFAGSGVVLFVVPDVLDLALEGAELEEKKSRRRGCWKMGDA